MKEILKSKTKQEAVNALRKIFTEEREKDPDREPVELMKTLLSNIGYQTGYYDHDIRHNMEKWLGAIHPMFGPLDDPDGPKTSDQFLQLGKDYQQGKETKIHKPNMSMIGGLILTGMEETFGDTTPIRLDL